MLRGQAMGFVHQATAHLNNRRMTTQSTYTKLEWSQPRILEDQLWVSHLFRQSYDTSTKNKHRKYEYNSNICANNRNGRSRSGRILCELDVIFRSIQSNDVTRVMGDYNAKMGSVKVDAHTGCFWLRERNGLGNRLIEFCQGKDFMIANSFFKILNRRLYTW